MKRPATCGSNDRKGSTAATAGKKKGVYYGKRIAVREDPRRTYLIQK
jgi:hypothetical protein